MQMVPLRSALWSALLGVVLALAVGLPAGASVRAGEPAVAASLAVPEPVECVEEAGDAVAASVVAVGCDREVEVLDARSEWASTFALPDGSMRLDTSIAAVRTDVSGEWEPVDPSVVEGDGGLVVASAVAPMTFSDGTDGAPLARIERDGHEVVFDAPFDLTEPTVDGSQVTYPGVLPGVDLVVTVNEDATGFSEVLRVESPEAAAHPELAELTFDVQTSDGIELRAADGAFAAVDAAGDEVFTSPVPVMWDSSTPTRVPSFSSFSRTRPDAAVGLTGEDVDPTVAPAPGASVAVMSSDLGADTVTIAPDADLLADPGTTWPVFIDPGISGSLNQRMGLRTSFGNRYNFTGDEGVGVCDVRVIADCDATYRARVLWQFAGLQTVGNLEPDDVQSAVFAATGTHSYSCTPMPVTLHAVDDFNSGTVYPGGNYWQPLQTHNITHRAGCGAGKEPRRIEFDATWQARAVASANTAVASFGMAADEGSMASWKRYAWDATFSITYNRAPSLPANARTTAPYSGCRSGAERPAVRSATPVLRAVQRDPDGGNLHGRFVVDDISSGARTWDSGWLPAQGSGAEQAATVPAGKLSNGRSYRWSTFGGDGIATGASVVCEFTIDLTPPVAPGVTPVTGMPAVYVEDGVAGGIGVEGRFRLDPGTSTDVAAYRYTVSGQPERTVPASYRTISVVPTVFGSQTLKVSSIDKAGWVSPERLYRFTAAPAGISDAWQLDEASGTTAANVASTSRPLTVASGVARVPGVMSELGSETGDRALQLDAPGRTAGTKSPIVRTDTTFSVMATVRLDDVDGTYTAVSQDGTQVSGFELGHRVDPACPAGTDGHCWAFGMATSDTANPTVVRALSAVPASPGDWVQLTGIRDTTAGTLRLSVCTLGAPGRVGDWEPVSTGPVPIGATRPALGGLQLGRGQAAGAAANGWKGAVGQVRTYTGVVADDSLFVACFNPTAINPVLDAPPAIPPAPSPLPSPPPYHEGFAATLHVVRGATWYLNGPGDPSQQRASFGYGNPTDTPVVGDWNGDGVETVGVFRAPQWLLNDGNDASAADRVFTYGTAADVPIVGDWNGDGIDTVGVVQGTQFHLNDQNDGSAPERKFIYGDLGDIPVVGDWNGDGIDTIGVFRKGYWYLNDQNDASAPEHVFYYGRPTDVPVTGDWNGDGIDTVGVFRNGEWFLNDENKAAERDYAFLFGAPGDFPARGSGLRR